MVGQLEAIPTGIAKLRNQWGEAAIFPNLISGKLSGPRGRMRMSVYYRL
jgi:hypothetical protein